MSRNAKRISILTVALLVIAPAIATQFVRTADRVPVISAAGVGEFLKARGEASPSFEAKIVADREGWILGTT